MNVPSYYALQQCDAVSLENTSMPYIKSFYSCLNRVIGDGYTDSFEPYEKGFKSVKTNRSYKTEDIHIINFFRFEGNSNPNDNVTMYIIEAKDGVKGTYIHAGHSHHAGNMFTSKHESMS